MNDTRTTPEIAAEILDEMRNSGLETFDDQLKAVTADRFTAERDVRELRARIDALRDELEQEVQYLDALLVLERRLWEDAR